MTGTGPDDDFETDRDHRRSAPVPGSRSASPTTTATTQPVGRAGRGAGARLQRDARLPRRPGGDRARPSTPTVGCTPATSARSTSAGACASSGARRTCSSSAASTRTRPRSRTCCSATPRWAGSRWSGCPTSASARWAWRSSCPRPAPSCDPDELIAWARGAMANYKVPRVVEIVDEPSGERRRARSRRTRCAPVPRAARKG